MTESICAGQYIVSPYIREVPAKIVNHHINISTAGSQLYQGDHVLVDELNKRLVIVPEGMWNLLELGQSYSGKMQHLISGGATAKYLEEAGVILLETGVGKLHNYQSLEIEVNSHCNFRCKFCPVKVAPKPRQIMPIRVFKVITERACEYGITQISLSHYSEPTLDPLLLSRISLASSCGLEVEIYSNGSGLDPDLIDSLISLSPDISLIVNFPSADPHQYTYITGAKCFNRVVRNLRYALRQPLPVTIAVNAPLAHREKTLNGVQKLFGLDKGSAVILWETDDRAGQIKAQDYSEPHSHAKLLGGCLLALQDLNVAVDGKVFLCAQDYEETYVLGDILTQSIKDIAEGEKAIFFRQVIFGLKPAHEALLCHRCAWTVSNCQKTSFFAIGNESKVHWDVQRLSNLLARWPIFRLENLLELDSLNRTVH